MSASLEADAVLQDDVAAVVLDQDGMDLLRRDFGVNGIKLKELKSIFLVEEIVLTLLKLHRHFVRVQLSGRNNMSLAWRALKSFVRKNGY